MSEVKFQVQLDAGAIIKEFNDEACQISGYTKEEVIGKNWFEVFIPESNMMEVLEVFQNLFKGDNSYWEFENEITCKNGEKKLLKWSNEILRNNIGKPYGISSKGTLS
ncbi:MAG: PAS domain S-box protein [Campylobacterales bacterium]|nr:PAS domain S-box protein [Campylobacterales bacterium]